MDTAKGREPPPKPPVRRAPPSRSLPQVLARIRRDAVDDPAGWLHEAEVPPSDE